MTSPSPRVTVATGPLGRRPKLKMAHDSVIKLDAHRNATFFNAKGRISLCLAVLSWLNPFPNDTSLEMPRRPVPE
jgi:hypothetical protein